MRKSKYLKILKIVLGIAFLFILFYITSEEAFARPGGGSSFSRSSSGTRHYGGGSSGGGGDMGGLIFYIIFDLLPPQISIPLIILIFVVKVVRNNAQNKSKKTVSAIPTQEYRAKSIHQIDVFIETLKRRDPNFSKILFFDFVNSLYNKFYTYRGSSKFNNLLPFLSSDTASEAAKPHYKKQKVTEIVIGSMDISEILMTNQEDIIVIDMETNYTISSSDGKNTRYVQTERWKLQRNAGVLSKEPDAMRTLTCPNCGAASNFTDAGQCDNCQTFIKAGEMQWVVAKRIIMQQETFKTQALGTYSAEQGTGFPTIKQPGLDRMIATFSGNHSMQNWDTYWNTYKDSIIIPTFEKIYDAWSRQKWMEARHLVSDRLFESFNFWIEAYSREKLVNRLDKINISNIDLARIDLDKFYESFTVRIFASCLDYVEDRDGKVIGGSKKRVRKFSEYWTFIRRSGVETNMDEFDLDACPNCGAPTDKIGQAAECGYCGSKLSTGDFSWILAVITQDEVYKG